jgi:hypothetical protein
MTPEQIHASLDAMLANPKAKNFLNHLVRAYTPITNVIKVMEKPKGDFKCVLTRDTLVSVGEIKVAIEDEKVRAFFLENLEKAFADKSNSATEVEKLIEGKKLAVTGKDTTTFMSYAAFQEFYNWVITKSLKSDKHINWLLGSIRRASFIERAESIGDSEVQNFKKPNSATFTLADSSDILTKLKADLEAKGK